MGIQEFEPEGKPFDEVYGALAEARKERPLYYSEKYGGWVVTRYDDLVDVARSPNFTVENALQGAQGGQYCPEATRILETGVDWNKTPHIQSRDGPDHKRFRRAIMDVVSPRRLKEMKPIVEDIVDRLIDGMITRGSCEFVNDFASPMAMLTVLKMVGFEEAEDDMSQFPVWVGDTFKMLLAPMTPDEQVVAATHAVEYQDYIRAKLKERRANPKDDVMSDILRMLSDGRATMTEDELVIMFTHSFVGAGHETTKLALTNTVYQLLSKRERWEQLCESSDQAPAFVEEGLRYDAPLLAWYRFCQEDTEIGGQLIKKGDMAIILFGSANHDEAKFADAEEFCPFRTDETAIMTFNTGKHFCPGAPLARLELNTALRELATRIPSLRLKPGTKVEYTPNFGHRNIPELYLEWDLG